MKEGTAQESIVTLTMNPTIDKSATVEHVAPDQKLRCEPPRHDPGGGGINVSRVVHRLGGATLAIYPVGGPIGAMLKDLMEREGVDHHPIDTDDLTRENLIIFEDSTDQQFRFGMPGPSLSEDEWQACLDALREVEPAPDYVVASGSLPPGVPDDLYARVARLARERGARAIVDTSGQALCAAAEEGVYLLKPNMRELGQLAGEEITGERQQVEVAQGLLDEEKAEVVVVSMGAGGAILVTDTHVERLRSPTVPIRSKIGAGDSMVAGIVLGLAQGRSVRDAVRFGMAAGAAAVMTPGTELCIREDVERLYERMLGWGDGKE